MWGDVFDQCSHLVTIILQVVRHYSSDMLFGMSLQFVSQLYDSDSESAVSVTDDPTVSSSSIVYSQIEIETKRGDDILPDG